MAALSLRDATPDDLPLVVRFVRELADYEKLSHLGTGTEAQFARLLFGSPRRAEALIARWGEAPAGFALWYHGVTTFAARPTLYVEDVYVAPALRGQGIGRAIFAELARRAVEQDCARMEWSVLDWNAPSIAFYRSIGARPHEGWTTQRLTGEALTALAAGQG